MSAVIVNTEKAREYLAEAERLQQANDLYVQPPVFMAVAYALLAIVDELADRRPK